MRQRRLRVPRRLSGGSALTSPLPLGGIGDRRNVRSRIQVSLTVCYGSGNLEPSNCLKPFELEQPRCDELSGALSVYHNSPPTSSAESIPDTGAISPE
jgi:hypothetical protein